MIYIPILKNREAEMKTLAVTNNLFSDQIIPMIEIIEDFYPTLYVKDANGEYVKEVKVDKNGKASNRRVKREPLPEENCTLEEIQDQVKGKKVFIDFFRFQQEEYPKNSIDYNRIKLTFAMNNREKYEKRLAEVSRYANMIPVISIKPGFVYTATELEPLCERLQSENQSIALRIHFSMLKDYRKICESLMRNTDYIFADIRQEDAESHFLQLREVAQWATSAKRILLNSPRDNAITTTQFEINGITELIDNSARDLFAVYGLDGFGDFAGAWDRLPQSQRAMGSAGSALALIYRYDVNGFESFRSEEQSGNSGFAEVAQRVLAEEKRLNPDNDCYAYQLIHEKYEKNKVRSWPLWMSVGMIRYIHQIYKYM